jgi:hypothetical protein
MHVNVLPETRDQISALVQKMSLSEADVVGFAVRMLYDEKFPHGARPASPEEIYGRKRRGKDDSD